VEEERIHILAPNSRRDAIAGEVTRRRALSIGFGGLASIYEGGRVRLQR
jgi:hypothetical protein